MRYFRHTIAEHLCSKHCGYCRSDVEANISPFHLIAAAAATVPLWLLSIREGWPWYYLVSILAGELLLVFVSGFILCFNGVTDRLQADAVLPELRSTIVLAGRHFDPLGSQRPHLNDMAVFVVFSGLNVAAWISMARGVL